MGRSRQSIAALMDIRPDYANMERAASWCRWTLTRCRWGTPSSSRQGSGSPGWHSHPGKQRAGYRRPHRGIPSRDVAAGDEVISGCVNLSGLLRVRVTRPFEESTVAKILDSGGEFQRKEGQGGTLYHQVRPVLHPAVVLPPLALAVIPPCCLREAGACGSPER